MTEAAELDEWLSVQLATVGRQISRGPAVAPHQAARAPSGSGEAWTGGYRMTSVTDVTPRELANPGKPFLASAWHQLSDGRALLATGEVGNALRLWAVDPHLGSMTPLAHSGHGGLITDISIHELSGDRVILATSSLDSTVRVAIHSIGRKSIRHLTTMADWNAPTEGVSWCSAGYNRLLLAVGSRSGELSVCEVNALDGTITRLGSSRVDGQVGSVEWFSLPDGRSLLTSAGAGSGLHIWELDGSGRPQPRDVFLGADRAVWHRTSDGVLLLATYAAKQITVWVVDHGTGLPALATQAPIPGGDSLNSFAWQGLPDGRNILVGATSTGAVHLFAVGSAPITLDTLGSFQCPDGPASISSFLTADGHLALAAGTRRSAQILSVRLDPAAPQPAVLVQTDVVEAVALRSIGARRCSLSAVMALGAAGLWLGLGVVDDIISLTGPASPGALDRLHDDRFRAVANSVGVTMLRSLDWPAPARAGFAGLIARHLAEVAEWAPPDGVPTTQLISAVLRTPTAQSPHGVSLDVSAVLTAFDDLDRRVVTLLELLGAPAVAADPALPLRLVDRVTGLPVLPTKLLMTLDAATKRADRATMESTGVERSANSLPVEARHGRVDRLVSTHLALALSLNTDQQAALEAGQQLLYRRYTVPSVPPSRPVAVVLDTTAPTFGPIESVLRTVAHMLTLVLWQRNAAPMLITLTNPSQVREITAPEQLVDLWTSRTLSVPDPAPALTTAATTGLPVIMLTTHHLAQAHRLVATSGVRLVTTHTPSHRPRSLPRDNYHFHLPTDPMPHQVTAVIAELLTP
jgi:hypothetical protein